MRNRIGGPRLLSGRVGDGKGRRAPLLVPSPQGWAGRRLVREMRIRVDEQGTLLVERPGGRTDRLAGPGEITRIVLVDAPAGASGSRYGAALLPADAYGVLVFLAGERPVLALRLAEWLPTAARDLDDRAVRDVSGANAVAAALGLAVEPGDPMMADWARGVVVSPRPSLPAPYRALLAAGYVATAVWFVSLLVARLGTTSRPALAGLAGATGALLLTVAWLATRRIATKPLAPPHGREIAPVPAGPVPKGFRERCRLYVSPDWVVLVDAAGREAWMPGPASGGVTFASVTTEAVVLDGPAGIGMAALPRDAWIATREAEAVLRERLAGAGLAVRDEPSTRSAGAWLASPLVVAALDDPAFGDLREARGVPSRAGVLGGIAGAIGVVSAIMLDEPLTAAVAGLAMVAALATGLADLVAERRAGRPG